MNNVTCIVGLPGSGKTFLAEELVEKYNGILVDDPQDIKEVLKVISHDKHIIITDPMFCFKDVRVSAESKLSNMGLIVNFIYFENNPKQCIINSNKRVDKDVYNDIMMLTKVYEPGNKVLRVYKP